MTTAEYWLGLELRHLAALRAIADEGSFKGAAALLGYTPSAISQQVATLERIVGVQVVVREHGRKALGLTDAGEILLRHMSAIEGRLGAAKADIEALTRGVAGSLRIGAFESVESRVLPEILGRLQAMFPEVEIEIEAELQDLEHLQALERGALDIAFTVLPLPPGPLETELVLKDPWVLVLPVGSEQPGLSTPPTLCEIAELPLVCFRSPRAVDFALRPFRAAGLEPTILFQSDYNVAVQGLAAVGFGVALMPRLAVNPHDERTAIIELGSLIPPREVAVAWHCDRARSEVLEAFLFLATEIGSQLEEMHTFRLWATPVGDIG
jgi:DNA-binding transcriptional LysR family regulator